MNTEIIDKVRKYVEEEYEKPGAHFREAFKGHFGHVTDYAKKLAEKRNADVEIVLVAAWLHDIGSVVGEYEKHHIASVKIAEEFLRKLNYPEEKIEAVKHCILHHRGSYPGNPETEEARILIDADSMSHFDEIDSLIKGRYYGAKTIEESKKNVLAKLERSYKKLSQEAKEIIKPKFEAAMLLLK